MADREQDLEIHPPSADEVHRGRLLVCVIVEREQPNTEAALSMAHTSMSDPCEDLWVFSSAAQIPLVLRTLGIGV